MNEAVTVGEIVVTLLVIGGLGALAVIGFIILEAIAEGWKH